MAYGRVVRGGHPVAIFDPEAVRALPPTLAHDMPSGEPRVIPFSARIKVAAVNSGTPPEDRGPALAPPEWPGRLLPGFKE